MDSNIDLKFSPLNCESEALIDLNQVPTIGESYSNGDGISAIGHDHNPGENENPSQKETTPFKLRRNLSNEERWEIFSALVERSVDGNLKHYHTREVSDIFSVSIQTIQRIWRRAKVTASNGEVNVSHINTGNCGRKKILLDLDRIANVPLQQRTTLRSFAMAMDMNLGTLYRRKKEGVIRRQTNSNGYGV